MLGRKAMTVYRRNGSFINGIWVEGTQTTVTIRASKQPLDSNEMESLPEGRRTSSVFKLISSSELRSVEINTNNPDRVIIDGEYYEVIQVYPWQNGILNHFVNIVGKCQQ